MSVLTLAGIGCGNRTRTYVSLAARSPHRYHVAALADPDPSRLAMAKQDCGNDSVACYQDAEALLSGARIADVAIVGTQDRLHHAVAIQALRAGYDVLLEKPIATTARDVLEIQQVAHQTGRRLMICHVLRFTPFYSTIKRIISEGAIGDIASVEASEGVGFWHQAHSFVRGNWARQDVAAPMLLAKSCHDLDIITWLVDRPCHSVSSYGSLRYFTRSQMPEGAPPRCTDGCPHDHSCFYNATRYATLHRKWLKYVYDRGDTASDAEVVEWLKSSPYGRCVWQCDNDVIDRQVVSMEFAGGVTAGFTLTTFSNGREITIFGTHGTIRAGEAVKRLSGSDIEIQDRMGRCTYWNADAYYGSLDGHGGGDDGLVNALYDQMKSTDPSSMTSGIDQAVESHMIGYAAEESRCTGRTVNVTEFRKRSMSSLGAATANV